MTKRKTSPKAKKNDPHNVPVASEEALAEAAKEETNPPGWGDR